MTEQASNTFDDFEQIADQLSGLPDDLASAFMGYERAILANDTDALANFFADGERTYRGDEHGLLVGTAEINAFRGNRGGVAKRSLVSLQVVDISDDTKLVTAVSVFDTGGRGLQTQLWRKVTGSWQIHAAHVTGKPKSIDSRVWRVTGSPLVPATNERGVLAGSSLAVKDLFAVRGFATGLGNPEFLATAQPAEQHAHAVQRLLDSGSRIAGIAQTDEFAYSIAGMNAHYGTPPNPAAPGRISGGSSSGSASAVSLGYADIGLGTDTGGSIRVPASYQGLWGIRTTHDLVDRTGLSALSQRFDTVGWLTRDGDMLGRVAGVLAEEATNSLSGQTVVLAGVERLLQPDVAAAFAALLHGLDCSPRVVEFPWLAEAQEAFRVLQAYQAWQNNGSWVRANMDTLGPGVRERFEAASAVSERQAQEASAQVQRFADEIEQTLGTDLLLLPSASSVAPNSAAEPAAINAIRSDTLRLTVIAGISGRPAVSVPVMHASGFPVGACVIGARMSDRPLIAQAQTMSFG